MKYFARYLLNYMGVDSHYKKMFMPSIEVIKCDDKDDITPKIIIDLNSKYRKHKFKEVNIDYFYKNKEFSHYGDKYLETPLGKIVCNIFIKGILITKGEF